MEDLVAGTAFAEAYREAEARKAQAQVEAAAENARREAAALAVAELHHVYDPRPYPEAEPDDRSLYEGTGIGALYGFPDCERFLPDLGDWTIGRGA